MGGNECGPGASDDAWRERVLWHGDTEPPGSGRLTTVTGPGRYRCGSCGALLFDHRAKFESTTPGLVGWPAFAAPASETALHIGIDLSLGMVRHEVTCAACGGHLGHLFDDPASPNGVHYCINSCVLDFTPDDGPANA